MPRGSTVVRNAVFFFLANASKIGILVPFPITNDVIMTSVLLLKGQVHGSVHAH